MDTACPDIGGRGICLFATGPSVAGCTARDLGCGPGGRPDLAGEPAPSMARSCVTSRSRVSLGLGVLTSFSCLRYRVSRSSSPAGRVVSISKTNLGNLVGPLPGWEAFGVWNNPDYQLPPVSAFSAGMWTAFVLALVVFGGLVLWRRGRWMLPVAGARRCSYGPICAQPVTIRCRQGARDRLAAPVAACGGGACRSVDSADLVVAIPAPLLAVALLMRVVARAGKPCVSAK